MADPVAESSISLPDLANDRIANILASGDSSLANAVRRVQLEMIASTGYYAAFGNAPAPRANANEGAGSA